MPVNGSSLFVAIVGVIASVGKGMWFWSAVTVASCG